MKCKIVTGNHSLLDDEIACITPELPFGKMINVKKWASVTVNKTCAAIFVRF